LRLEMDDDRNWKRDGNCADPSVPTSLFFPTDRTIRNEAAAKAVCRGCPVKLECMEYSLSRYEAGIWAGMTEGERERMRRERRRKRKLERDAEQMRQEGEAS
jgi:WhiB family transcriptional regulator, redox-sensing transcriptional regulator